MKKDTRRAFTLIELLVVIAILAILAVVVVLVLNPAELLKQSRDANRLSDMQTLNSALGFYTTDQTGASSFSLGSSSVLYVSVPDPMATSSLGDQCQGLGLPALPTGWTYQCASPSVYHNTDGTGWIPVDFKTISAGSPVGSLPVDPVNTTSTRLYYTYATNGSQYQLYSHFESSKNVPDEALTGGYDPASYKMGTNVNIAPFAGGMTAYWPMNEGSGGTTADLSGYGYTGAINGATWTTSGCLSGQTNCLSFDGVDDYVQAPAGIIDAQNLTVCSWAWITYTTSSLMEIIIADGYTVGFVNTGSSYVSWTNNNTGGTNTPVNSFPLNTWNYVCATRNGSVLTNLYINGNLLASLSGQGPGLILNPTVIGAVPDAPSYYGFINGYVSGVRVYDSVLSGKEIEALYSFGG